MRLLIIYSLILAFIYLLFIFVLDTGLLFGYLLTPVSARLANAVLFMLIVATVWGLARRRIFSYYLAMGLYSLSILSGIVSLFSFGRLSHTELGYLSAFLYPISIATIILNSLTLWYLSGMRPYFEGHEVHEGVRDTFFRYSLYAFLVMLIVFVAIFSVSFFLSITRTIDSLMRSINDQSLTESLFYCEEKQGTERDLCYVSLVTKHGNEESIAQLCERIESDFYKFTCYRATP
jgi:hypothetical protein